MTTISPFRRAFLAAAAIATMALAAQARAADATAYISVGQGDFGTLDLATGAYTLLGNTGLKIAGFGTIGDGSLYASSYRAAGQLFTVDPSNGHMSLVGTSNLQVDDFGSTTTGLYAIGRDANLYSISASTGLATFVGSTGLAFGSWRSLSMGSSTLYFANGDSLYTLDTSNGAATKVGSTGGAQIGAMALIDGQLYGGANSPAVNVATINTTTGAATVGAGLSDPTNPFYAIAPVAPYKVTSPVPEPQAAWLMLAGLGLLFRRRRSAPR